MSESDRLSHNSDAALPSPTRDTAGGDVAPSEAPTASVNERDAALLLDMKEPAVANPAEPEQDETQPRSILNAAEHSTDDSAVTTTNATGDDDEEDLVPPRYGEKGVQYSLSELFVNPNLKSKAATAVLRKDPFAIPRATDNVTEYRPRFNPLSILVSEEKLLPRDFKFDFSEGIPDEPKPPGGKGSSLGKRDSQGRVARSNSDFDGSSLLVRKASVPPIRNPQSFGDKLATMGLLMGSMPRQPQDTPTPLINTPTVHNPFGETLLGELVAHDPPQPSEYAPLQRLRAATAPEAPVHYDQELRTQSTSLGTSDFDVFGVDVHNISNLSKLSIAATAADSPAAFHAGASTGGLPPLTPPALAGGLYDGLANYLPNHFAEKREAMDPSLYEVSVYPSEYPTDGYLAQDYATTPAHSDHASQPPPQDRDSMDSTFSQSLQPISKKPRSKNVFRPCTHPGCSKGARGKSGLCQKHGGGKRCATPNCPKGAQGSSKFCLFHGGGYRCTYPGCTTGARGTSGLCAKHGGYKRAREGSGHSGGEGAGEANEVPRGNGGPADKKPRMEAYEGRALEASG